MNHNALLIATSVISAEDSSQCKDKKCNYDDGIKKTSTGGNRAGAHKRISRRDADNLYKILNEFSSSELPIIIVPECKLIK